MKQINLSQQFFLKKFISLGSESSMDKLRKSYSKYQEQVFAPEPRYVSSDRTNNLSKLAQTQLEKMRAKQEFTNYDQAVFYKQKFSQLVSVATQIQTNKITESAYLKSVRQIMKENFSGDVIKPPREVFATSSKPGRGTRSKSPLDDFFEQEEVKKSKSITFSQLLSKQETPLKYNLRSICRSKSPVSKPQNDDQLRQLEQENRKLRQKINSQRNLNTNEEERLRQLRERLRQLDEQNRRLKTEVSRSQRSDFFLEQEYDPYNIKVRQNNIVKIHSKNLYMSQKMSQFSSLSEDLNIQKRSHHVYYQQKPDQIREQISPKMTRGHNYYEAQDMLNASQSTIQTQFLNLEDSELYDDERNQLCRQKIAFFKKSMVLVMTPEFQIAFKRSEFNYQMDKLRLILYVNNKTSARQNCIIEYDYDREDFDIVVHRPMKSVEARSQARQQLEITLKNPSDLGSIIHAKVLVGSRMKKITVPALFIDFDIDYKYQFENVGYLERNLSQPLTIRPMSQFLTIDRASNILDLTREYEQKYPVGKLYGKSKACKGMVKLTWRKDKLKIQTCEEWRTLMGYLFLNAQETLNY